MIFEYSFLHINIFALIFGVSLSWYFGGIDSPVHPDKLIESVVSYCEKAFFRSGTYKEGIKTAAVALFMILPPAALILFFTANAGSFWYFILSVMLVYFCIDKRFSVLEERQSYPAQYLSYAVPVIFYTIILGPLGALFYRIFPVMVRMLPVSNERFSEFGKFAEQTYSVLRDSANLVTPIIVFIFSGLKKIIRFLKSFRP